MQKLKKRFLANTRLPIDKKVCYSCGVMAINQTNKISRHSWSINRPTELCVCKKCYDKYLREYQGERKLIPCGCKCGIMIYDRDIKGHKIRFYRDHGNKDTQFKKGNKFGIRFKKGEHLREAHPLWKGGKIITNDGYVMVKCPGHPKAKKDGDYVFEHVLVMEKYLGRYLTGNEHVHHIDRNRQNNDISNLQLLTASEHIKLHWIQGSFKNRHKK